VFGSGTVRRRVGEIFKIERYKRDIQKHTQWDILFRDIAMSMCVLCWDSCNMVLCGGALYHVCVEMGYLMFASVDGGKKDMLSTY